MVGGFYFAQITAVNIVSILSSPYSTIFHICLHFLALGALITGLVNIFILSNDENKQNSLD